jgi:hypothetical protein
VKEREVTEFGINKSMHKIKKFTTANLTNNWYIIKVMN